MKKYLINLTGGGDTITFIVGQAGWDYINQPRPDFGNNSAALEKVPAACVAEMDAEQMKNFGKYGSPDECQVTTGSWDNDRALHLSGLYVTLEHYPRGQYFEDMYSGCIY